MNFRDMRRTDWTRITKREYIARECTIGGKTACESLIVIRDITEPLTVSSAGISVKIVEKDYSWIQIAVKDARWWLTSMFDENGELLQIYFDITGGNRFDDPENPTFEDMYLDIVLRTDGKIVPLDQDELDEALQKGDITSSQYALAKSACDELYAYLIDHAQEVMNRCRKTYRTLKFLLETQH